MNIRRAELADTAKVMSLLARVWEDDYLPHTWVKWVEETDRGVVLVALEGDEIIGTCYIHFLPENRCWFQGMRVDPQIRRAGIGSALTAASLQVAKEAHCTHVCLGIDADNTPSLTMTAKAGFRKICDFARVGKKISPRELGAPKAPTGWREARAEDVDALLKLGQAHAPSGAIFARWLWQPLSRAALLSCIAEKELWVWGAPEVSVWAGFAKFDDYCALFPLAGDETAVQAAFVDMLQWLPDEKEIYFELWQPQLNALYDLPQENGFTGDDGYTIWEYNLVVSLQAES